ncbi:helix-turn-helix domain-containing protein [Corynebacterium sp. HMSC072A04]|uniref:helix-turn-helix domain-containing protein n=1 Tax=Corynebacterium sp. HMSC072A04 TaxID=1715045 RepID=UPI0008BBE09F|nr:helix-turn-helix domain-containing protein [Corynebacterium sp. HMSC072A04]OFN33390.1 hypothetical protein HMPREF2565_13030 [Corynebacterium sp. HMSC072A04]
MNIPDKGTSAITREMLSPQIRELLDYPSGSNSDWASAPVSIALAVMNAGGDEEDYNRIVLESALGESAKRPAQMLKRLGTAWEQAGNLYDPGYSNNQLAGVLDALTERVSDSPEFNRGQRLTALALLDIAREVNAYSVDASARRISLLTGFSADTSARHLRAIADSGLVSRVVYNGRGKARSFVLNLGYYGADTADPVDANHEQPVQELFWTRYGAGPTARAVYDALGDAPETITQVADSAGVSHATAKRYLGLLHEHGLAGKDTSSRFPRWYRSGEAPDNTECEQAQQQRAEKYDNERRFYREEQQRLLEEALIDNEFRVPAYRDLAFTPEQTKGKLYWELMYRLSEKGKEQARAQGWAWRHWEIPEEFREYLPEDLVGDPWDGGPVLMLERPVFTRVPHYSAIEPGMYPFEFGPRPVEDLYGPSDPFDWLQPPRRRSTLVDQ